MSTASSVSNSNNTLTQANFLQLLVTQMTSQDPLNPESDTEFASQLAQFSALQETQTMTGNLQGLQADTLIGQTVSVTSSTSSQAATGVVTGVEYNAGTPEILMNGQTYGLNQITAITPTATQAGTASTPTSSN